MHLGCSAAEVEFNLIGENSGLHVTSFFADVDGGGGSGCVHRQLATKVNMVHSPQELPWFTHHKR